MFATMARRNAHFSKTASTLNKKASNSTVKAGAAALLVGVTVYSTFYGAKIWTNRHEDIPKHARDTSSHPLIYVGILHSVGIHSPASNVYAEL
ncbi:hypothetical protein CC2G_013665 [Coprinopsis cinerea AmutBmut pab1-1]|nr:hypothetical protein CC2G_013665 [Coprinopsis cinerea AmutBmut pab1-1]